MKLLKDEESNLERLLITDKISEEAYDHLRVEWQEKALNLRLKIEGLEFDARKYLDDLEVPLALFANLSISYDRLEQKQKSTLLRIPVKRIIINKEGEIISRELHPPFSYLSTLIAQKNREKEEGYGSEFVPLGAQIFGHSICVCTTICP